MEAEETKTRQPASIILCHAEPHWIRAWQYEGIDPNYSESNLKLLEKRLGKNVAIFIAATYIIIAVTKHVICRRRKSPQVAAELFCIRRIPACAAKSSTRYLSDYPVTRISL